MAHGNLPEGVSRGPDGKFVSSGGGDRMGWHDTTVIHGSLNAGIPAADLAGRFEEELRTEGPSTETLDFSEFLDNDEMFHALVGYFRAELAFPVTATSESWADAAVVWSQTLGPDEIDPMFRDSPFISGTSDAEDGIIDVTKNSKADASTLLHETKLVAEASNRDTVNGTGGGSDYDRDRRIIPLASLYGSGPVFSEEDELYTAIRITGDGVSDHSVQVTTSVALRGVVLQR